MRSSTSNLSRNSSVFAPGSGTDIPAGIIETIQGDNCVTHRYASGKLVTKYDSGTIKEKSADSKTEITRYINGDVQQHLPDGKVGQKLYGAPDFIHYLDRLLLWK